MKYLAPLPVFSNLNLDYEANPQFIIKNVYSFVVDIKIITYSQVLSSIIFQTSSGENHCKKF